MTGDIVAARFRAPPNLVSENRRGTQDAQQLFSTFTVTVPSYPTL